jgi:very-short-patch-repair endonuclease
MPGRQARTERPRVRGASREMVDAARALRRSATPAEQMLWSQLRTQRFAGLKFRRQHAVGSFVLDFFCAEPAVAIELDGSVHDTPEQRERDAERTVWLGQRGIRVLRIRNERVLFDLPAVLSEIYAACVQPRLRPATQGAASDAAVG